MQMALKNHIPNLITLLNLFCGVVACIFTINNNFVFAALFVFFGIFFDFFDGFFARKLHVQSALGLQLDSLADVVTSGVVPGLIMFKLIELASSNYNSAEFYAQLSINSAPNLSQFSAIPFFGVLITLASAYRLAKFNIDQEQQDYFKGLPTPANTMLILSLPLILEFQNSDLINNFIVNPWFLISVTLISCYLLNSPIKLFALKFKNYSFKDNAVRYSFIIFSFFAFIILKFIAIPLVIFSYILISIFSKHLFTEYSK